MIALSSQQIRDWDQYTIQQENSTSLILMERAANACVQWMTAHAIPGEKPVFIFCGKGNNGGDGLAIARLLSERGHTVIVYIIEFGKVGTPDFQANLQRLHENNIPIHYLQEDVPLPLLPVGSWIIDALLGTGANRFPEGRMAALIHHLNQTENPICSIDLPSGMLADRSVPANSCITATVTLSFQCFKPALLFADNAFAFGKVVLLDIGLHPDYLNQITPLYEAIDRSFAASIFQPRGEFSHKGHFGHALLLAGSVGKMGAAILAGKACLRSGPGLLSFLNPTGNQAILQIALPEAMCLTAPANYNVYRAVGCGPGLGTSPESTAALKEVLNNTDRPLVLDADALNLLAMHADWQPLVPYFSIVTPHPKEFDRLAGSSSSESERWQKAIDLARSRGWVVILKGHFTLIAMPGGKAYFNTSGNASMAKGGSGDVLTGMLTGLLTHGYSSEQAAILGVYLHGRAGELASIGYGMESSLATDTIEQIGAAFKEIGA
ncbi:MAG TPA: NAD(P)H-hydrate dehydratase [Flavihumibacter sp.]|nr:NAD(P)H-hydrate dehydratase [Flavihumibacter sp.]